MSAALCRRCAEPIDKRPGTPVANVAMRGRQLRAKFERIPGARDRLIQKQCQRAESHRNSNPQFTASRFIRASFSQNIEDYRDPSRKLQNIKSRKTLSLPPNNVSNRKTCKKQPKKPLIVIEILNKQQNLRVLIYDFNFPIFDIPSNYII